MMLIEHDKLTEVVGGTNTQQDLIDFLERVRRDLESATGTDSQPATF